MTERRASRSIGAPDGDVSAWSSGRRYLLPIWASMTALGVTALLMLSVSVMEAPSSRSEPQGSASLKSVAVREGSARLAALPTPAGPETEDALDDLAVSSLLSSLRSAAMSRQSALVEEIVKRLRASGETARRLIRTALENERHEDVRVAMRRALE